MLPGNKIKMKTRRLLLKRLNSQKVIKFKNKIKKTRMLNNKIIILVRKKMKMMRRRMSSICLMKQLRDNSLKRNYRLAWNMKNKGLLSVNTTINLKKLVLKHFKMCQMKLSLLDVSTPTLK